MSKCSACTKQEIRCTEEICVLRPYFFPQTPARDAQISDMHTFGRIPFLRLLVGNLNQQNPPNLQERCRNTIKSIIYESRKRIADAVNGSRGDYVILRDDLAFLRIVCTPEQQIVFAAHKQAQILNLPALLAAPDEMVDDNNVAGAGHNGNANNGGAANAGPNGHPNIAGAANASPNGHPNIAGAANADHNGGVNNAENQGPNNNNNAAAPIDNLNLNLGLGPPGQ